MASRLPWAAAVAALAACSLAAVVGGTVPVGSMGGNLVLSEIDTFFADARAAHPDIVSAPLRIGTTLEQRPIWAYCIGAVCSEDAVTASGIQGRVPSVLFTGMHHSREPESMMTLVYWLDKLASDWAAGDANTLALLQTRQLWMVPVVNPDGYEWNRVHHPNGKGMARKNRRPGCARTNEDLGVDLNRNYDFDFAIDNEGSNGNNPCAEDYRGTAAFSEPETQAIRDFVAAREAAGHRFGVALNFHSFGKMINTPYSSKKARLPPAEDVHVFDVVSLGMADTNHFERGHAWELLYTVNGEASDWMFKAHGIIAYSPEVGPTDNRAVAIENLFWPAASQIESLAAENYASNTFAAWASGAFLRATIGSPSVDPNGSAQAADGSVCSHGTATVTLTLKNDGVTATKGPVAAVFTTSLLGGRRARALRGAVAPAGRSAAAGASPCQGDQTGTAGAGSVPSSAQILQTSHIHSMNDGQVIDRASALAPVTVAMPTCGRPAGADASTLGHVVVVHDDCCTITAFGANGPVGESTHVLRRCPLCTAFADAVATHETNPPPDVSESGSSASSSAGSAAGSGANSGTGGSGTGSGAGAGDSSSSSAGSTSAAGSAAGSASSAAVDSKAGAGSDSASGTGSSSVSGCLRCNPEPLAGLEAQTNKTDVDPSYHVAEEIGLILSGGVVVGFVCAVGALYWWRRREDPENRGFAVVGDHDVDAAEAETEMVGTRGQGASGDTDVDLDDEVGAHEGSDAAIDEAELGLDDDGASTASSGHDVEKDGEFEIGVGDDADSGDDTRGSKGL